jgi:hypothetical protein
MLRYLSLIAIFALAACNATSTNSNTTPQTPSHLVKTADECGPGCSSQPGNGPPCYNESPPPDLSVLRTPPCILTVRGFKIAEYYYDEDPDVAMEANLPTTQCPTDPPQNPGQRPCYTIDGSTKTLYWPWQYYPSDSPEPNETCTKVPPMYKTSACTNYN